MPNIDVHTPNAAPIIISVGAIIYGAIQAELVVAFLCAVLGAGFGLAFMPAPAPSVSKLGSMLRFAGNAGYILITATMTMFAMMLAPKLFVNIYPWSFFISLALMIGKDLVIKGFMMLIDVLFDGIAKLINRKLGNIGDTDKNIGDK